jgi:hypothetical protein
MTELGYERFAASDLSGAPALRGQVAVHFLLVKA